MPHACQEKLDRGQVLAMGAGESILPDLAAIVGDYPKLASIIAAWPTMDGRIKAAIFGLVRAGQKE